MVRRTMWAGTDLYMNTNLLSQSSQLWGVLYYMMRFVKLYFTFILDFRHGYLPLAKYLIEDVKCSPTCTDSLGRTPLHEACR